MKYNWDDQERIFELIKSLNHYGGGTLKDRVNDAIYQYEYFKFRMATLNDEYNFDTEVEK